MAILSFYLEKNDCVLEKPLILKLQLIFVCYLLGAQVLSGAYKNDNINRMIQPRPPLTYKTYEELLKNNFSVYSRSSDVLFPSFLRSKEITNTSKLDIRSYIFGMKEMMTGVLITSEIYSFASSDLSQLLQNGMKPLDLRVFRNSIVHPSVSKILHNVSRKYLIFDQSTRQLWTPTEMKTFVMEQNRQFWKMENLLIRKEFRK